MQEKELNNLNELEKEVEYLRHLVEINRRSKDSTISKVLFRGHKDASWQLNTTLERYTEKKFSVNEFNKLLSDLVPAVRAFTDKDWIVYPVDENIDLDLQHLPNINFMSYVRHHGFPTPIIDWTESLYVALFFAFQDAKLNNSNKVALYAYIETLDGIKVGDEDEYAIKLIDTGDFSHKRHHIQQGCYTIAYKRDNQSGWIYGSHEDAFNPQNYRGAQDILFKFTLPVNERDHVLRKLFEMNINAYTLYSNEESLLEMLAYKEIALKD